MTLALTSFVVLLASALQTATGFGFSILAVPLLLMLHTPLVAVQLNLIVSVFLSILLIRTVRADIDTALIKRLMLASVAGVPFGLAILLYANAKVFKFGTAILMLVFMGLLLMKFSLNRTNARDYICGWLAGLCTSAIGAGGLPLLLYFAGAGVQKAMARATAVTFFLFVYGAALLLQTIVEPGSLFTWLFATAQVPIAYAGVILGQWLYNRLSQKAFAYCIRIMLVANSVLLIIDAVSG